jgi:hypothetical protein
VRDVPTFRYHVPLSLTMAKRRGIEPTFNALSLNEVQDQQRAFDAEFDRLERTGAAVTVSPRETLCASGDCRVVGDDGEVLYRDDNHLTQAGARVVEPVIERCFPSSQPVTP